MGVIYGFSAQSVLPGAEVFWQDFLLKKIAHIGCYMVLFWTWFGAFKRNRLLGRAEAWMGVVMIFLCLLFAVSDEYHQSLVPGRTATWRDVGFDMLGVMLAYLWSYRLI
jgi:VanZ family protein